MNYKPPQGVQDAAARGLKLRQQYKRGGLSTQQAGKLGIGSGVARAASLARGQSQSPETISKMVGFFTRHQRNFTPPKAGEEPSNGWISFLLWGGEAGRVWSNKVLKQIKNEST